MFENLTARFKRPSVPAPQPEKINKGIPMYARQHHTHRRRPDVPTYESTAEFLKRDPLDGTPVGQLALAPRLVEWASIENDPDEDLVTYEPFPWDAADEAADEDGFITNEITKEQA